MNGCGKWLVLLGLNGYHSLKSNLCKRNANIHSPEIANPAPGSPSLSTGPELQEGRNVLNYHSGWDHPLGKRNNYCETWPDEEL